MSQKAAALPVSVAVIKQQELCFPLFLYGEHILQAEGWNDLVKFLQELCGLARHLQPTTRAELLGQLVSLGLFEVRLACRFSCFLCLQTSCMHAIVIYAGTERSVSYNSPCCLTAQLFPAFWERLTQH